MPRSACGDGRCGRDDHAPPARALDAAEKLTSQGERDTGMLWLVGGFLFCPCHLPLTLGVLGVVLAGTAAGALVREHRLVAAGVLTATWLIATWRGLRLLGRT